MSAPSCPQRQRQRLRQLAAHLGSTPPNPNPAAAPAPVAGDGAPVKVLVLGGLGTVGSGLRTYMPLVSSHNYEFTCVDLPFAEDKAPLNRVGTDLGSEKFYGDILLEPELLAKVLPGKDIVIYLARRNELEEMNAMTDQVFEACLAQPTPPFILCASSIHAVDGMYSVDEGELSLIAERRFDELGEHTPARKHGSSSH